MANCVCSFEAEELPGILIFWHLNKCRKSRIIQQIGRSLFWLLLHLFVEEMKAIWAAVILVHTTHIIMEGLCFAGVIARFSPLRCSTIQVPENTAQGGSWKKLWKKKKKAKKIYIYIYNTGWAGYQLGFLPPPRVQESRRLSKCYVFLPSDLQTWDFHQTHGRAQHINGIHWYFDLLKSSERGWTFPTYPHTPLTKRSVQTSVLLCAANTHRRTKPTCVGQEINQDYFSQKKKKDNNRKSYKKPYTGHRPFEQWLPKPLPEKIGLCGSAWTCSKHV